MRLPSRWTRWWLLAADEVRPALSAVERAVGQGLHAAGFVCYEAAVGLDPAFTTRPAGALPLVYFGLFEERTPMTAPCADLGTYELDEWRPSVSREEYEAAIERIRAYIAAGDTYQVNYTLRLHSRFRGDPLALYRDLGQVQESALCAYFDLGRHVLISASPELFFRLQDGRCTVRPMKGTRPRGRFAAEDQQRADDLQNSAKDRAENLMVTDMLRNDLGRISQVGSVAVPALWSVERYPTVWQLTSTVESQLKAGVSLPDIFAALFPCGSVTGAPKVRTMEIIAELERAPRGIYTGCMGYVSPGPEACFNVAIRTAHLDRESGQLEFGVGGGIVWESSAAGEYAECLIKAEVLRTRPQPSFELLETMLFEEGAYFLVRETFRAVVSVGRLLGILLRGRPRAGAVARRGQRNAGSVQGALAAGPQRRGPRAAPGAPSAATTAGGPCRRAGGQHRSLAVPQDDSPGYVRPAVGGAPGLRRRGAVQRARRADRVLHRQLGAGARRRPLHASGRIWAVGWHLPRGVVGAGPTLRTPVAHRRIGAGRRPLPY